MPDAPQAPIDDRTLSELLESTGGDREFLAELLATFTDDATRQIEAMRDAAAGGEPDGVTRAAHALKGASASVGAAGLSEQARVLELDARAGRLDGAATQIEEMALELERVAAALRDA